MYKVGVDLGGTNIAVGVIDENYNIIINNNKFEEEKNDE